MYYIPRHSLKTGIGIMLVSEDHSPTLERMMVCYPLLILLFMLFLASLRNMLCIQCHTDIYWTYSMFLRHAQRRSDWRTIEIQYHDGIGHAHIRMP